MSALTDDNLQILQQGITLLQQLSDSDYTTLHPLAFNVTIGSHLRHCFDFYHCFLQGLDSGQVDYTLRQRQEAFILHRQVALQQLHHTRHHLAQLPDTISHTPLLIREDTSQWSHSSVFRELQFLLSHTIHHYALIAFMLRQQGLEPPAEFGVAPSTLRHWQDHSRP